MKPIVLATDGSTTAGAAATTAIDLAATLDAPLVALSVWDTPYTGLGYAPVPAALDVAGGSEERAKDAVATVSAHARRRGVRVETVVQRGFPVDEICRVAQDHDARLIVVGSHGWGPIRRMLFGSVSTGVLHRATCPVLIVPAGDAVPAKPEQLLTEV
jgi:nucleotide-binding universal stress UspA family protein